jgi:PRC-barrel domain
MCSMRSVFQWVISGGLVLAPAFGGLSSVAGETKQGTPSSSSHEVRRLSMVIGGAVRIANGVSVGKIEDVVLNDSGCIDYVVVVYRDQYVAIPWTVATVDFRQRIVTVDITEERFATVPTFRRDEFSFLTKTEFTQKVHSVFDGKGEPKPKPAGEKAKSPKGQPKATKSEPKPEPAKTGAQENPKVESPDKPKGQPLDKPKGKSKGESKDKSNK